MDSMHEVLKSGKVTGFALSDGVSWIKVTKINVISDDHLEVTGTIFLGSVPENSSDNKPIVSTGRELIGYKDVNLAIPISKILYVLLK